MSVYSEITSTKVDYQKENYTSAYSELGSVRSDNSCFPATYLSFAETALYIAEATENEFNKLFAEIGINEFNHITETGTIIVYEAFDIKALCDKFVNLLKKLWARIKAAYETIKKKFNEILDNAANKWNKNIDKSSFDKIPEDKFKILSVVHSYENFDKYLDVLKANKKNADKDFESEIRRIKAIDVDQIKSTAQDMIDALCAKISGNPECTSVSEMNKYIADYCTGDVEKVNKAWIHNNLTNIKKILSDTSFTNLSASYKAQKEDMSKQIDNVKSFKDEDMDKAQYILRYTYQSAIVFDQACMKRLDVEKKRFKEYLMLVHQLTVYYNKYVVNESAALVESAFSW